MLGGQPHSLSPSVAGQRRLRRRIRDGSWRNLDTDEHEVIASENFEQKDRGEGNPDLLDDSAAVTLVPDRSAIETAIEYCCFDQQRFYAAKPRCIYNVKLVEWKDDVAYRFGVGSVHIDAWAQAYPKRTIVTLV